LIEGEIMTKIFGFIGSPLKEKSNTYILTNMMLEHLKKMDKNIDYVVLTSGQLRINSCTACGVCVYKGYEHCPLDREDDMSLLKNNMLDADIIIWGSPVHTLNVSGQMKNFIDRLRSWYHILKLAGKCGVTVTTSSGAGIADVHRYLTTTMLSTGIKVLANLDAKTTISQTFFDIKDAENRSIAVAKKIYPYITGKKHAITDKHLELCFSQAKKIAGVEDYKGSYEYWKNSGMLDMSSFADLLEKVKK
jgi:multimeric flavodoxin WrbA